jgi:predicted DNA-binding antitoxin AbrB/MazE fold protein
MSKVNAIYRGGVFQPLEPVNLREGERVRLIIEPVPNEALQKWLDDARRRREEFIKEFGVLPDSAPDIAADLLRDV